MSFPISSRVAAAEEGVLVDGVADVHAHVVGQQSESDGEAGLVERSQETPKVLLQLLEAGGHAVRGVNHEEDVDFVGWHGIAELGGGTCVIVLTIHRIFGFVGSCLQKNGKSGLASYIIHKYYTSRVLFLAILPEIFEKNEEK